MVERRVVPAIHAGVALRTVGREFQLLVAGRRGVQVFRGVTGAAVGRESNINASGGTLMAGVTLDDSMSAHQREPVLVLIDGLHRNLPAVHVVAAFAVCPHLPSVNIRVAIRTMHAHVREDGIRMARLARHGSVHSPQRIGCLVVIELRHVANRLPSRKRMAVLAGDVERTVRAMRIDGGACLLCSCASKNQENHCEQIYDLFRRQSCKPLTRFPTATRISNA